MAIISSFVYYGVTFTFTNPVDKTEFANGEPCIQNVGGGTVSISNITPNPTTMAGNAGSMLNMVPEARHGFGPHTDVGPEYLSYNSVLNKSLSFPILLVAGDSLTTSVPHLDIERMKTFVTLQVISGALPAGSFRPSPYGPAASRATLRNISQLNYALLATKAPTLSAPSQAFVESTLPGLPWIEWSREWSASEFLATDNLASDGYVGQRSNYGADIAAKWSRVAAWLQLNYSNATKAHSVIAMVQAGLDIIEYFKHGGLLWPNGGHKVGRKAPAYLAAVMLQDQALIAYLIRPWAPDRPGTRIFPEDECTFIIGAEHVEMPVMNPLGHYLTEDIGLPEWRINGSDLPQNGDFRWPVSVGLNSFESRRIPGPGGTPYRYGNWSALGGTAVMARLMNPGAWGHVPFHLYAMRHAVVSGGFVGDWGEMWNAYVVPLGPLSPVPANYKVGALVLKGGVILEQGTQITMQSTSVAANLYYVFIPLGGTDATPTAASTPATTPYIVTATSGTLKVVAIETGFVIQPVSTLTFSAITGLTAAPPINQLVTCS